VGKVIFEFDTDEDKYDISLCHNRHKMYDSVWEIYNIVRSELKHGDEELSDHIDGLLERILDESRFIVDFD